MIEGKGNGPRLEPPLHDQQDHRHDEQEEKERTGEEHWSGFSIQYSDRRMSSLYTEHCILNTHSR